MKPRKTKCRFSNELLDRCKQFAEDSFPTSSDQYSRRNQNVSNRSRVLLQLTNGKLGEELTYHAYLPYINDLTLPDYNIYGKENKSWEPDLTSVSSGVRLAVKTKDNRDALQYGASWIFELSDRKIFGSNLDGKNLDPNQYCCLVIVDQIKKWGQVMACVKLQWLHYNNLFSKPDRDYLATKLTVRLENMQKVISDPSELWQLPIIPIDQ